MLRIIGVDGGDDMNVRRLVERRRPTLRRARSEIAEFQRTARHPLAEFSRERRERLVGRSERPQPLVGQADVETDGRLRKPWRVGSDPRNVGVSTRDRYAKEFSRRRAVGDLEDEVAHEVAAIAAQDVTLDLLAIEYG